MDIDPGRHEAGIEDVEKRVVLLNSPRRTMGQGRQKGESPITKIQAGVTGVYSSEWEYTTTRV